MGRGRRRQWPSAPSSPKPSAARWASRASPWLTAKDPAAASRLGDALPPGWVCHGLLAGTPRDAARLLQAVLGGEVLGAGALAAMLSRRILCLTPGPAPRGSPASILGLMIGAMKGGAGPWPYGRRTVHTGGRSYSFPHLPELHGGLLRTGTGGGGDGNRKLRLGKSGTPPRSPGGADGPPPRDLPGRAGDDEGAQPCVREAPEAERGRHWRGKSMATVDQDAGHPGSDGGGEDDDRRSQPPTAPSPRAVEAGQDHAPERVRDAERQTDQRQAPEPGGNPWFAGPIRAVPSPSTLPMPAGAVPVRSGPRASRAPSPVTEAAA